MLSSGDFDPATTGRNQFIDCRRDQCPYFLSALSPESGDELTEEDTVLLSALFQFALVLG
jgi:hypothetical protein